MWANRISPCLSITPSPRHHAAPSLLCCHGDHSGFQLLPWWYPVGPEYLVHRDVWSAHKRWSGFRTVLGSVSTHQDLSWCISIITSWSVTFPRTIMTARVMLVLRNCYFCRHSNLLFVLFVRLECICSSSISFSSVHKTPQCFNVHIMITRKL